MTTGNTIYEACSTSPQLAASALSCIDPAGVYKTKATLADDLQVMTLEEVLKAKADAEHIFDTCNAELERRRGDEIMRIRAMIAAEAAKIGATLEDVVAANPNQLKPKAPSKPKYRNPFNHEQTWTGRGKKPGWLKSHLEAGGTMEEATIKIGDKQ